MSIAGFVGLIFSIALMLSSCSSLEVNANPFGSRADRYWNSEILLVDAEIDHLFYYGLRMSTLNWKLS